MPDLAEEVGPRGNRFWTPGARLGGKNTALLGKPAHAVAEFNFKLGARLRRDQVARAISARMKRAAQTNNSAPSMVVTAADSSE
jgi:hypothetical protein